MNVILTIHFSWPTLIYILKNYYYLLILKNKFNHIVANSELANSIHPTGCLNIGPRLVSVY